VIFRRRRFNLARVIGAIRRVGYQNGGLDPEDGGDMAASDKRTRSRRAAHQVAALRVSSAS
jgi:hypothetical protein